MNNKLVILSGNQHFIYKTSGHTSHRSLHLHLHHTHTEKSSESQRHSYAFIGQVKCCILISHSLTPGRDYSVVNTTYGSYRAACETETIPDDDRRKNGADPVSLISLCVSRGASDGVQKSLFTRVNRFIRPRGCSLRLLFYFFNLSGIFTPIKAGYLCVNMLCFSSWW